MKKKILMTIAFVLSLSTMFFSWFGGFKGVQEVSGLLMLENPIVIPCIVLTFVGIWSESRYGSTLGTIGMLGIIAMEIYELLTWHILTVTGYFDVELSLAMAYPEFWFALFCIIGTFVYYKCINRGHDLT